MDGDTYKLKADFGEVDAAVKSAIDAFNELHRYAEDAFESVNDDISSSMSDFDRFANLIEQVMQDAAHEISTAIENAVADIINHLGGIPPKAKEVSKQIVQAADSAGEQSAAATEESGERQKTVFSAVSAAAETMWASITGGATLVTGFIGKAFGAILSPIKTVFSGIWGAAKSAAGFISNAFKGAIGFVKGLFSDLYGVVKELLPLVGVGLGAGLAVGFKELQATEAAMTRVSAAVKATGQVAGFTSDQLKAMADEMESTTRFGDDVALQAQAVALQFKNVRGDIFAQALKTSADAAIAWGTDLSAATEKVVRALDDPLEGFKRLAAEGTKFSKEEKELIERLVETGDVASAQRIILSKLASEVGGQASADLNTFGGMLAQVNNAMGDAWKAIAEALLPAVKQVVGWFKQGADTMASWAPVLGMLTNDFITWANKSSGTFAEWGAKAQEIFMKTFDFVVDAATRAFSFVQTMIQDFPGFMEAAKAKFALYWEQIKQGIFHTWEAITVFVENIWEKLMIKLARLYANFITEMKKKVVALPGGSTLLGQTKQQIETEAKIANQLFDKVEQRVGKKKAQGQTAAEAEELARLQQAAEEAGGAFGEKFKENYDKNKETVNAFLQRVKDLTGLDLTPQDLKPTQSGEGFTLNKEEQGKDSKAGGFEDLLSLQKRIQGATSAQTPEAKAMVSLPNILKDQHREKKALKEKEIAERKQQAAATDKKLQEVIDAGGLA